MVRMFSQSYFHGSPRFRSLGVYSESKFSHRPAQRPVTAGHGFLKRPLRGPLQEAILSTLRSGPVRSIRELAWLLGQRSHSYVHQVLRFLLLEGVVRKGPDGYCLSQ